jgi:hypothetical protein
VLYQVRGFEGMRYHFLIARLLRSFVQVFDWPGNKTSFIKKPARIGMLQSNLLMLWLRDVHTILDIYIVRIDLYYS